MLTYIMYIFSIKEENSNTSYVGDKNTTIDNINGNINAKVIS